MGSGWLDGIMSMGIQADGADMPGRGTLNLIGFDVADNAAQDRTDVSGALGRGPFTAVLYVDATRGDDATAARGNAGLPYKTIASALAAAESGDVISIGPGNWTECLTHPNIASLRIVGSGRRVTNIANAAGVATATYGYTCGAANAALRLSMEDLTLTNNNAVPALLVDGTLDSDVFSGGLFLRGVDLLQTSGTTSYAFTRVGLLDWEDVYSMAGSMNEVGRLRARYWDNDGKTATWSYDSTDPLPGVGRAEHDLERCILGTITLAQQATVRVGPDCAVGAVTGNLTDEAAGTFGTLSGSGRFGTIDLTFDFQTAQRTGVDISGATITTSIVVEDGGATAFPCTVRARGANFTFDTKDKIEAGAEAEFDLRGAAFFQESLVCTGTGAIDRDRHVQAANLTGGADAILWADSAADPVPFVTMPSIVLAELSAADDQPAISLRAAAGCTVTAAGADAAASVVAIL
jgi:hypothetical protein